MKKVLVIEDDLDTAQCLDYLINDLGYEFIQSQFMLTPTEIIKINPDVIILDYYLPNGHGDKLCLELKSNLFTKETPVILMSAHNNLRNISKKCDADAYL
jgi:two-component system phosphate regulon response regulator PhoB